MNHFGTIVKVIGGAVFAAAISGLIWWMVSPPSLSRPPEQNSRFEGEARQSAGESPKTGLENHDTMDMASDGVPATDPGALREPLRDAGSLRDNDDFELAIQAALDIEDPERRENELNDLLAAWAGQDPVAAADFCLALDAPEGVRDGLLRRVLHQWTADDPAAAILWADALTGQEKRDAALRHALFGISRADPGAAVRLAQEANIGAGTADVVADLAMDWARRDLPSAYEWAINEPNGLERDAVMARLAFVLSQVDPALAAGLVEEDIRQGRTRDDAVLSVLHQWSLRDIESALDWADQLPPGELYDRVHRELEGSVNFQMERMGNTE